MLSPTSESMYLAVDFDSLELILQSFNLAFVLEGERFDIVLAGLLELFVFAVVLLRGLLEMLAFRG